MPGHWDQRRTEMNRHASPPSVRKGADPRLATTRELRAAARCTADRSPLLIRARTWSIASTPVHAKVLSEAHAANPPEWGDGGLTPCLSPGRRQRPRQPHHVL